MAVIINEFEVVAEPPSEKVPDKTPSPPPAQSSTPHDVENILRRQRERCERVRAH